MTPGRNVGSHRAESIGAGSMGTLLGEVAALGLAVAFTSPVSVVTVIVLPKGGAVSVGCTRSHKQLGFIVSRA